MIDDPHFLGLFHFGGFALGIAVLVAINWNWIYARTDRGKLGLIRVEARTMRQILIDDFKQEELERKLYRPVVTPGLSEGLVTSSLQALKQILDDHNIPHPDITDRKAWLEFVSRLEPTARDGWRMKTVRELYRGTGDE